MRQKTTLASFAVGILVLTSVAGSVAAVASETPREGPAEIVQRLAPQVAAETDDSSGLVSVETELNALGVAISAPPVPDGAQVSEGVSFSIDYANESETRADGVVEFSADETHTAGVVQPTGSGVRVLTTILDPEASDEYSYTFDVPEGTDLVRSGSLYHLKSDESFYGSLSMPWAIDAAGKELPTSYSWNGTTLTQHVDHSSSDVEYPVVADPAWQYSVFYELNKTPSQVRTLLKSCFNCYFPVTNAPTSFPTPGQLLPLTVGPMNFECTFTREFSSPTYFGYQFDATANHVDGAGSNIIFEFVDSDWWADQPRPGWLLVSAYIANDASWLKNNLYRDGAYLNWQNFANNLNMASMPQA